jgi:hypothetical protein
MRISSIGCCSKSDRAPQAKSHLQARRLLQRPRNQRPRVVQARAVPRHRLLPAARRSARQLRKPVGLPSGNWTWDTSGTGCRLEGFTEEWLGYRQPMEECVDRFEIWMAFLQVHGTSTSSFRRVAHERAFRRCIDNPIPRFQAFKPPINPK